MKLFGTDGVRGAVNSEPMTPETVQKLGMAAARVLTRNTGRHMVLIGKDTRLSGYMLESALTSGICSMGLNVTLVGPIPTPGVAFLTRALRVDAGVVISASHNPFNDNGIKFFSSDGRKLPDSVESEIESLVAGGSLSENRPPGKSIGKAFRLEDASGRYIEFIKSTLPRGFNLEGLKVVVDSANGAAYKITPSILKELGAEVISIHDKPDGININHQCGSLHIDALAAEVLKHGAHAGVAHDGDADRTLMCDETGHLVDGDRIMGVWATELMSAGALRNNTVVATVMSNLGLELYLKSIGVRLIRTAVGDRYVTEEMLSGGYNLGGEQSGHIIIADHNSTGDGPLTALHMLYMMKSTQRSLSSLTAKIQLMPQVLVNVKISRKRPIEDFPEVMDAIRRAEKDIEGKGRLLVRPSGTEPKIRVMLEGSDQDEIKNIADGLASIISTQMAR